MIQSLTKMVFCVQVSKGLPQHILYQITIHYTSLETASIAHRFENLTVFCWFFCCNIKFCYSSFFLHYQEQQLINGAQVTYIANTIEFLRLARCRQRCTRLFHGSPKFQTRLNIIDSPDVDKSTQGYSTSHVHFRHA